MHSYSFFFQAETGERDASTSRGLGDVYKRKLWEARVAAGEARVQEAEGRAGRDTLRLEAGMPLYGHEPGRPLSLLHL
nr:hypothetical protein [Clavibacter michiganensis]